MFWKTKKKRGGYTYGAIKRTPADAAFSEYIRERDGWTCQRCKAQFNPMDGAQRSRLHCSHFKTRGNPRVRFDEDNAKAMCVSCHDFLGKNPDEHHQLFLNSLGKIKFDSLVIRANTMRSARVDHYLEKLRWTTALKFLRLRKEKKAGDERCG